MTLDQSSSLRDLITGDAFILDELGAVPPGGTTGKVLAKASGADRDTEWVTGGGGGSGDEITNQSVVSGTVTVDASRVYVRDAEVHPGDGSAYLYSGHIQWKTGDVTGTNPGTRGAIGANHFEIAAGTTTLDGDLSGVGQIGGASARFLAGNVTISGSTGFAGSINAATGTFAGGSFTDADGATVGPGTLSLVGGTDTGGGDVNLAAGGDNRAAGSVGGNVRLTAGTGDTPGNVMLPDLPTSNPGVAGAVWRSGNDVKISTGP